jgi:GNAT superfamily N-acetyltransferase
MDGITIRPVDLRDAGVIARLVTELGYPTDEPHMRRRLERLLDEANRVALVAERGGAVAGVIGVRVEGGYEFDGFIGRIDVLVVSEPARGKGVGRALVGAGEAWVRERGATRMFVTTAHRRTATHRFYASLGFESTGLRFVKQLPARTAAQTDA